MGSVERMNNTGQVIPAGGASWAADVERLAVACRRGGHWLVTAESCTGGLIAAACTSMAGSSEWFERGFVTYSNASKTELLGVAAAQLDAHGAVSEEVALAMAAGALARSRATLAVATTGIAGPGGAVPGKPVGTVWLAWAARGGECAAQRFFFSGDRAAVRDATVHQAVLQACRLADSRPAPAMT